MALKYNILGFFASALVALLLVSMVAADEPQLIVAKTILTRIPTANQEVHVSIRIFNVGTGPAFDLHIDDRSWLQKNFTADAGLLVADYDKLPAGESITHNFVVIPTRAQAHSSEPAVVAYKAAAKGAKEQYAVSSTPGYGYMRVYRPNEVPHRSLPHYFEWTVFAGIVALSIAIPALMYSSSVSGFAALRNRK